MASEIIMPKLGLTMTEGSVVRWIKQDGDTVKKGEPIFEVQTDKVVLEVESPDDGVLRVLTGEGITVPVLTTIGWVVAPGEEVPEGGATAPVAAEDEVAEASEAVTTAPVTEAVVPVPGGRVPASPAAKRIARENGIDLATVQGTGPGGRIVARDVEAAAEATRVKASPVARRMARDTGLDLSGVVGTGPGGRITKEDVERALAATPAAAPMAAAAPAPVIPADAEKIPVAGIRKVIFDRMAHSSNTVAGARVTEFVEVDATSLVEIRTRLKDTLQKAEGLPVGYNDLLVMIVAKALKEHRLVNSTIVEGEIRLLPQINIGPGRRY